MQRIALYLREDQIKKLNDISEETGAPVAELIRRAIDHWLKSKKEV